MLEAGRVTCKQLILLIFVSRIVITLTYFPAFAAPPANQDIWLSELLSLPGILLLAVPVYLLGRMFPNESIIQYSQTLIGKAGKLIGVLYVWLFIQLSAITLMQFSNFLTTAIMPETPVLFVIISLTLVCAYAARCGLEVISRMSEIIAPIIMIAVIMIALLLLKDMDLKVLTPVMEKGFLSVLHGGFTIAARTEEILGLAMVLPYLNDRRQAKTVFPVSFLLVIMCWLVMTIPTLTVLGVETAKTRSFPYFSTIKLINVGDFFERIEAVHMGIWLLGVFIKLSFFYYLAALGLGQLFNLQDYKPLVLPVGTVIIPLSILIVPSIVELREFTSYKIFTWYALFFILLIPSVLFIIALIRKKGERHKCRSASSPG